MDLHAESVQLGLDGGAADLGDDLGAAGHALGLRHAHGTADAHARLGHCRGPAGGVGARDQPEVAGEVVHALYLGALRLVADLGKGEPVHHGGIAHSQPETLQRDAWDKAVGERIEVGQQPGHAAHLAFLRALTLRDGHLAETREHVSHGEADAHAAGQPGGGLTEVAARAEICLHGVAFQPERLRDGRQQEAVAQAELEIDEGRGQASLQQIRHLASLVGVDLPVELGQDLDHGVASGRLLQLLEEARQLAERYDAASASG